METNTTAPILVTQQVSDQDQTSFSSADEGVEENDETQQKGRQIHVFENPNTCWRHRIRRIVKEYCPRVVVQGEHYGIFVTPESKDFDNVGIEYSSCEFAYERMAIALIEDARAHKYDSKWAQEQARLTIHGWNYAIRQADKDSRERSHLMKELMSSAEKWRQKWDSRDEEGRSTSRIWAEEVLMYPHKNLILSRTGKTKATERSKRMYNGNHYAAQPRDQIRQMPVKDLIENMRTTNQQSRTESETEANVREIQTNSRILWTPEQDNLLANTFLELSEKYSEDRIFTEVAKQTFDYVPLVREGEKGDLRKAADRVRSRWCVITYHVMGLNKREKMTFSEDMKARIVDNMRNYKVFAKDKQKREKVEQKLRELDSNISGDATQITTTANETVQERNRKSDKEQIRKRRKPINGKKKVQKCAKENAAPTVRISSSGRIIKTNVRV